jgi:hypothetical protein
MDEPIAGAARGDAPALNRALLMLAHHRPFEDIFLTGTRPDVRAPPVKGQAWKHVRMPRQVEESQRVGAPVSRVMTIT